MGQVSWTTRDTKVTVSMAASVTTAPVRFCYHDALGRESVRRIIACVQACDRVPTETLEAGVRIEAADNKNKAWINPKDDGQ